MSETKLRRSRGGKNKLRVTIINLAVFILVTLILIWGVKNYLHIGNDSYTNDAQVEAYINPVSTRVSAYIKEIRFTDHQHVRKGDTLLVLDNREIMTQLGQAEGAYMNARAGLSTASSTVNTVLNNVAVVESNIAEARARLWNTEQQFKRYESLLKDEAVTRQQFEQVETEYLAQKARYESLISQKRTTSLSVEEAKTRTGMNKAEIKRTKEALEMARLNLSYTVIKAPSDGVVGRRSVNVGQLLQAGQQVAVLITDENKWVTANFREKQMKEVQIGGKVNVAVDALGGKEFEAVITAISEATGSKLSAIPVDNSTGNFVKVQQRIPVRIEFTKNNRTEDLGLLRAGMNVEIQTIQ